MEKPMDWTQVSRLQGSSLVVSRFDVEDKASNDRFFTVWELSDSGGCIVLARKRKPNGRHQFIGATKDGRRTADIVQALKDGAELFSDEENGS
jgi:hypothetical protein